MSRLAAIVGFALLASGCGDKIKPSPSPRAAASASAAAPQLYAFHGTIVNVDREKKQAEILHDEIPGYMAAMQMVYPIKDDEALERLAPGVEIKATLVTVPGEYWLREIVFVGGAKAPAPKPSAQRE